MPLPGYFDDTVAKITPFAETTDQEATVSSIVGGTTAGAATDIKGILATSNYVDDDAKDHEISAKRGFVFHYSETGYDSIAYGGLKK